jgi:hypothetical protein
LSVPIELEEFARLLGAEIAGEVPDVGGGSFGMARLARILHRRLAPGEGERPGQPTDPSWEVRPKVPMSEATFQKLTRLARELSTSERQVSPMQVAAHLLEEALGRVSASTEGPGEALEGDPNDPAASPGTKDAGLDQIGRRRAERRKTVTKKAKGAKKRSGQITLRVSPEQHADLAWIADTLGLDINGLLRLMIARTIGHYRMEAETLALQAQENLNLLHRWREEHPGRPVREFWDEYWRYWHAKNLKQSFEAFTGFNFEKAEELAARAAAANKAV